MAAIVSVVSRHGLTIEVHCRNQSNKSKLALYKLLLCFYSYLKHLYISNKMEHFSYKGGCGMYWQMCIKAFNRRAGLSRDKRLWGISKIMFLNQAHVWFLKIDPMRIVSMCVCLCVCPPLRLSITSGMMWHDMNSIQLVKQVL